MTTASTSQPPQVIVTVNEPLTFDVGVPVISPVVGFSVSQLGMSDDENDGDEVQECVGNTEMPVPIYARISLYERVIWSGTVIIFPLCIALQP